MKDFKRIFTVVLDSVGVGASSDAKSYGDEAANTVGNISKQVGVELPNLEKLGLGNLGEFATIKANDNAIGMYAKMKPMSVGKDTMAGHWEMMGAILDTPFNVYVDNGFPEDLIQEFERLTGKKVVANKAANGMKVIEEYIEHQMQTGDLIVYTSIDSTFQIAAHEDIIPVEDLYKYCDIARELTSNPEKPEWSCARVIARPYIGNKDNFERTANRKDYSLDPCDRTVLDDLKDANYDVIGLGKIYDIYNGHGLTESIKTYDNQDGVDKLLEVTKRDFTGLAFLNLVEFDSHYGHPRDVEGYKGALEEFDARLPEILNSITEEDLLVITADHGNDPTFTHNNDHTREDVPLIVFSPSIKPGALETRNSFADLGATIAKNFKIEVRKGTEFNQELKEK